MDYSHIFGSQFPNSVITLKNYKDVGDADDTTKELIIQFQKFMDADNIASASALYEANKDALEPYYFGMEILNRMGEEIYNTSLFALKQQTSIISKTEPEIDLQNGASWFRPLD